MSRNFLIQSIAESENDKEGHLNDNTAALDAILTETVTLSIVGSGDVITLNQFTRGFVYKLSNGGVSGAFTVSVPAVRRGLFWVLNQTLYTATIEITSQPLTSPTVSGGVSPNLSGRLLYCDGANVIAVAAEVTS